MTGVKCQRCGHFWSIGTNNPDLFKAITRLCPDCIAKALPIMGSAPIAPVRIAIA